MELFWRLECSGHVSYTHNRFLLFYHAVICSVSFTFCLLFIKKTATITTSATVYCLFLTKVFIFCCSGTIDSCSDLNTLFPHNTAGGVSSAIVLAENQTFSAFTSTSFGGLQNELKPGKRYPTPDAMGFPNDKMQSIRKM